ncbi:MAG: hypothetical protein K6G12_03925 [Lachnospiraceae bacterium]|nr:hypothetical protein [Lachnospiraceae bacterium]
MHLSNIPEKIKNHIKDPDKVIFAIFFVCMLIYYTYRMFAFAPWYDELYTYNFFISRGPVYAGIHWPVPNNHLGYSALSGFIYVLTHSPYISLRGISYLCSLGNLIMLFIIGKRFMVRGFGVLLPVIYAGAWQVNNITVQGRGYALSVNMMLITCVCLIHLCFDEKDKLIYYILWAAALCIGFYTVMTTLYWVVTVCFTALCCLLCVNKRKRLIKTVIASVFGAVGTLFAYSCVWLAIGSNLLSKDETSAYYGMYQLKVIAKSPILSLKTGAEYMLATPYIQSVSDEGYFVSFFRHWYDILCHMYTFGGLLVFIIVLALIIAVITLVARYRYIKKTSVDMTEKESISEGNKPATDNESLNVSRSLPVFSWFVICFTLVTPVTVYVQTKLPYVRVFTFYAFTVALCAAYLIYVLFGALKTYFTYGITCIICLLVFALLLGKDYNMPYGEREEAILTVMKQADFADYCTSGHRICLTDCNQEYMYRFLYDEYPEIYPMEEADIIMVDKDMLDPEADYHWEFYYDHSNIDFEILDNMDKLLRNTYYEVFISKDIDLYGGSR